VTMNSRRGSVRRLGRLLLCLIAGVWLASPVSAQAPPSIPFQGLLLDAGGIEVTGTVDLDFELFDAIVGGTSLWSETHVGVMVVDGLYSVELGSTVPLTADLLGAGAAFLEITVDAETLAPRQQLLSVPYALVSGQVGSMPATFASEIMATFPFDGMDPPNFHPDEGVIDTDGDGVANFIDTDNDDDGVTDAQELINGTSINLKTPIASGVSPNSIEAYCQSTLTVTGTGLDTVASATFGAETPSPYAITAASFTVDVTAPTAATSQPVVGILANGESDASPAVTITDGETPSIGQRIPVVGFADQANALTIIGSGFCAGVTVGFGTQVIVPDTVTPTSLSLTLASEPAGTYPLTVDHPNGRSDSSTYTLAAGQSAFVFITEDWRPGSMGSVASADALCQADADAAGLPGTYKAWISESLASPTTSSPATTFNPTFSPYVLPDGTIIANDWADLTDGSIQNPINLTADGLTTITNGSVWTGTLADGTAAPTTSETCIEWTALGGTGMSGNPTQTTSDWTNTNTIVCSGFLRLYCFGQ